MAEEFDKNEEATPFKLREARKKGQVAKSTELPAFFSMAAILVAASFAITGFANMLFTFTSWWIENAWYSGEKLSLLTPRLAIYVSMLGKVILPIFLAGLLASIIASLIHVGPVFSLHPLKPDLSKINPAKGLKKVFSRRLIVDVIKLALKFALFAITARLVWGQLAPSILNVHHSSISSVLLSWKSGFFTLAFSLLFVFLLFALFDLWYAKREFSRQMKMSKRDIKDEYKRHEGDPQTKSKRKKILSELRERASNVGRIRDADVIITNPTHVAVALKYRSKSMALPILLVAGKGFFAYYIKQRARKFNVPIVRKPKLARDILASTKQGYPIDIGLQENVAEIYRWVLSLPGNKVHT